MDPIQIADAVANELKTYASANGTVWSVRSLNIARRWLVLDPGSELLNIVQVAVIPGTELALRVTRAHVDRETNVSVWFQKKVSSDPDQQQRDVDALVPLPFQVRDYFSQKNFALTDYPNVFCEGLHSRNPLGTGGGAQVRTCCSPVDLASSSLWVAVVDLIFRQRVQQ